MTFSTKPIGVRGDHITWYLSSPRINGLLALAKMATRMALRDTMDTHSDLFYNIMGVAKLQPRNDLASTFALHVLSFSRQHPGPATALLTSHRVTSMRIKRGGNMALTLICSTEIFM